MCICRCVSLSAPNLILVPISILHPITSIPGHSAGLGAAGQHTAGLCHSCNPARIMLSLLARPGEMLDLILPRLGSAAAPLGARGRAGLGPHKTGTMQSSVWSILGDAACNQVAENLMWVSTVRQTHFSFCNWNVLKTEHKVPHVLYLAIPRKVLTLCLKAATSWWDARVSLWSGGIHSGRHLPVLL